MNNPFERFWRDSMEVYGWESYEENNITKSREVLRGTVKCHYSQESPAGVGKDGIPDLESTHKLFCPVGAVAEGDKVVVTQSDGKTVNLSIGEGFPYCGGMQHIVKRSDKA